MSPGDHVLDYGCGPGYLAAAVAPFVHRIDAVDISTGALACARVLNDAPNVEYLDLEAFNAVPSATYDLAYSFAVAQHVTDRTLSDLLSTVAQRLKPGGKLLLHAVVDAPGWRTERDWRDDVSVRGKMRFRFALHCFTRTADQIERLVKGAGFGEVTLSPLSTWTTVDDDVARQHLVTAVRN